jgi:hypothetical protein
MFVYVIVCSESLKLYVGQHKGPDLGKYFAQKWFDAHRYSGKRSHLYAALRKHPRESWSIHPLISGIEDKKELDEWERMLIYALKSQHPDVGYNICDGGEGHTGPCSEEAKRKISADHRGTNFRYKNGYVPQPREEVERRRAKQIGRKRTPEQCARIAAGRSGKGFGQRNAAGKRTGQALENLREMNKRVWTPERRAAQRARITAYNLTRQKTEQAV